MTSEEFAKEVVLKFNSDFPNLWKASNNYWEGKRRIFNYQVYKKNYTFWDNFILDGKYRKFIIWRDQHLNFEKIHWYTSYFNPLTRRGFEMHWFELDVAKYILEKNDEIALLVPNAIDLGYYTKNTDLFKKRFQDKLIIEKNEIKDNNLW